MKEEDEAGGVMEEESACFQCGTALGMESEVVEEEGEEEEGVGGS